MNAATKAPPGAARNAAAPDFAVPVPPSGYRWWYVDGISDDGECGVVVIAFIGSVFSPYYFRARQRGPAEPQEYCAINVGLYRKNSKLWAMTERSSRALERGASRFRVGPSRLEWAGDGLRIHIAERSMPLGRRMQGRIVLRPGCLNATEFALDPAGRHRWRPIAPLGRIELEMDRPRLAWQGTAYFDTNDGDRALEDDFRDWNWSRHGGADGAHITYAARLGDGSESSLALDFDAAGRLRQVPVPPEVALPTTGWRLPRATRAAGAPRVVRTLEDTPFYARSLLAEDRGGRRRLAMHESLSLERFRAGWVRLLLPFRMPRLV